MLIYVAGPLFNEGERWVNNQINNICEKYGFQTYLPQRDIGVVKKELNTKDIYKKDLEFLDKADLIVACFNGTDVDSGTAWEAGYAIAKNKPVVGLYSDVRSFSPFSKVNPMMAHSVIVMLSSLEEVDKYLKEFAAANNICAESKKDVIVLLSGGMDSVCALYDSIKKHNVIGAISFDYRSKHNHKEIPYADYHCKKNNITHYVIDMDFMGKFFTSSLLKDGEEIPHGHYQEESMKKTVVPFRNGIMLSVAAGFAESKGAEALVIAAHAGDHAIYPDCREEFLKAMSDAITFGTYEKIQVLRPFVFLTKSQIAKRGHDLGVDFSKTWSCYEGGEIHCGKCGTCVERKEAFLLAKITDPTKYM